MSSEVNEESFVQEQVENSSTSLFDVPVEDVLFPYVFSLLEIDDLCRLKRVNSRFAELVLDFFRSARSLDWSSTWRTVSENAMRQIMSEACSLRCLNVSDCRYCFDDKLLSELAERNYSLRVLRASGCTQLSDVGLHVLAASCPMLVELRFNGCRGIGDDGLQSVALNCPDLSVLVVDGNWGVGDRGVCAVANSCSKLAELSMSHCYSVTDRAIEQLGLHCGNLRQLHVCGCWRVTNRSVRQLGEHCKSLKRLSVSECRDITEASLALLRQREVSVDVPIPKHYLEHVRHHIVNLQI